MRNTKQVLWYFLMIAAAGVLLSCAGKPDSRTRLEQETRSRSYQRFLDDHELADRDDLNKAGIHVDGRTIHVVISLSDSGTDRYPEWACDRVISMLDGYGAIDRHQIDDETFAGLARKFSLESLTESTYENIARVVVRERDIREFVEAGTL